MVVAQFHSERRLGGLRASLFHFLLRDEAGNHRISADSHVFWLHRADGSHVLATDWYNRLLRRIHVYQEDIRSR